MSYIYIAMQPHCHLKRQSEQSLWKLIIHPSLSLWLGKDMMALLLILPLSYCKRGLGNCREQRRWGRRESSWGRCYLDQRELTFQPHIMSQLGCSSNLVALVAWQILIISHLPKAQCTTNLTCRASMLIFCRSLMMRVKCWETYVQVQYRSWTEQTTSMIQMLTPHFTFEKLLGFMGEAYIYVNRLFCSWFFFFLVARSITYLGEALAM